MWLITINLAISSILALFLPFLVLWIRFRPGLSSSARRSMPVWQHWRQRERKSKGYWTGSPQRRKPSASETRSLQLRLQSRTKNSSHSTSYAFSLFYVPIWRYIWPCPGPWEVSFSLLCRYSWRSWKKSFQRLNMPQSPANTRASRNSRFPRASDHSQVSHRENSFFFFCKKLLLVYKNCRNELSELIPASTSLFLPPERRSALKLQPAVPIPLEHLDPQTPELSQLVSQWQKLWLLAVARQKHLEQHQQALKEVIVHAAHCSHLSLFCKTLSKLHYLM